MSRIRSAAKDAMGILEQMSMGGIGADGPTLEELNEYAKKTGQPLECADYHTVQLAWRTLERGLSDAKIKNGR